jgi:hypothetical protein
MLNDGREMINELVPLYILSDSAYLNTARVVTTFKVQNAIGAVLQSALTKKLALACSDGTGTAPLQDWLQRNLENIGIGAVASPI